MKKILILFSALLIYGQGHATHLMGGEMTVSHIDSNRYLLSLVAYRDTVGIQMQRNASFLLYGPGQSMSFTQPYDSVISGNLLPMYPYGVEVYFYHREVVFPSNGVWNVSFSNCCRNGAIQNLRQPLQESMWLQTEIRIDSGSLNSTPYFLVPAAIYLPVNTSWQYNPLPFDPDGDSLVWSLDTPLAAQNQSTQGYVLPSSDTNNIFRINPVTGTISWTADKVGNFVTTVLVDQYRNGRWMGEIRRDMQFIVVPGNGHNPVWNNLSVLPKDNQGNIRFDLPVGQNFKLEMLGGHSDTSESLHMGAFSPLLRDANSEASFSTESTGNDNEIKGTFTWQPQSQHLRQEPHLVVFRLSDGYLTDDKTVQLLVKNASGLSLSEKSIETQLKLFPNPAQDQVFIELDHHRSVELRMELISLTGQIVMVHENLNSVDGKNLFALNVAAVKAGAYLLRLQLEGGKSITRRLLIER